jgi:hypothetical protein
MRHAALLPLLLVLTACDTHRYGYVECYQEREFASLELGGSRAFFTAAVALAEALPPAAPDGQGRTERQASDYEYGYMKAHPEIYGPLPTRADYLREYGGNPAASNPGCSRVALTVSADYAASFEIVRGSARLVRGGESYPVTALVTSRVAVGDRNGTLDSWAEGGPAQLEFPALPRVAPREEHLRITAINRRPPPETDPVRLELAVRDGSGVHPLVFVFRRVAWHEPFAPNPLYSLYAAH